MKIILDDNNVFIIDRSFKDMDAAEITQRFFLEREAHIIQSAYDRMVLMSRDEKELTARNPHQIRNVGALDTNTIYEERLPAYQIGGVELPDTPVRKFRIIDGLNENPRWVKILVGEQQKPIEVSLVDMGVIPDPIVREQELSE